MTQEISFSPMCELTREDIELWRSSYIARYRSSGIAGDQHVLKQKVALCDLALVALSERERPSAIAALTEAERAIEAHVIVGNSAVRLAVVQQAIAEVRKIKNRLMEAADGK